MLTTFKTTKRHLPYGIAFDTGERVSP